MSRASGASSGRPARHRIVNGCASGHNRQIRHAAHGYEATREAARDGGATVKVWVGLEEARPCLTHR
jgi:hypothetical protein